MAFEFEEPGDLSDDDVLRRNSQFGAKLGIVLGGKEWREIEAAENFCVLPSPPNPRRKVLFRHGVGDGDKMSGDAPGAPFRGAKNEIGESALKFSERGSVNGVDDDRHSGACGRKPSQDAGLAAVCMNNLRPAFAKKAFQFAQSAHVFQ